MQIPSCEVVMRWLEAAQMSHYICDQCHGIHIVALQALEGVQESRVFVEEEWVLFSTELELRPSAVLGVIAEVARFNMQFPALKVFVDISDEALPRLIMTHALLGQEGITQAQFLLFMDKTMQAVHEVLSECERLGFANIELPDVVSALH